jgi:methyl-accepting chemotaxis protein
MKEVVDSIKRVTDIMGEISAASGEQSMGVQQVGEAVMQMDQATQQNAALVEEMAAAASSLKSQAQELVQVVAEFKVDAGGGNPVVRPAPSSLRSDPAPMRAAPKAAHKLANAHKPVGAKAAPAAALPRPAVTTRTKPTPAGGDDDWETF